MNPLVRFLIFVLGALLVTASSPAASNSVAAPLSPAKAAIRSRQIKERIDALFQRRLKPEPLPVILPNPFLVVGGAIDATHTDEPESGPIAETGESNATPVTEAIAEPAASNDAETLARYILSLKIGGTLQLNGQLLLMINQSPRKEGDFIFMDKKDAIIYLRVIRITPAELTLGFNDAVQTVRLKN